MNKKEAIEKIKKLGPIYEISLQEIIDEIEEKMCKYGVELIDSLIGGLKDIKKDNFSKDEVIDCLSLYQSGLIFNLEQKRDD